MRLNVFCLILYLIFLALPCAAADVVKLDPQIPIDLEADQLNFDESRGLYHAQGKARLTQGLLKLTSEEIWWNQQTGDVEATGDVRFTGPGEVLSGRRITYNLQQGTGVVYEGEAYWQEKSLRVSGKRLERQSSNHFRVYDGRFTLCDGERPAWSFGASKTDVTVGRYITAKNALLYIKDVPSFYLPYVMIPIKSARESGFLMPSLGFSDRRGTEFSTAWYQVLGRNMDMTFYLDHLSSLGTGTGLEYRYILKHDQRGEFKAYTVFAREGDNRWRLDWRHFGQITDDMRLVVDAEYVNERDYFADYGDVTGDYNEQKVISNVFVNQRWAKASLTGQFKSIKDLETEDPLPWQSAPLVAFSVAPLRLARSPLYVGLKSSYTGFRRDQGTTGQRLMLNPSLGLHSFLFKGLEFDSEYSYRQNQYSDLEAGMVDSTGSSAFRARLSSSLFRVFGGGERSWLHGIEPEINYNRSEANLSSDFPDFDRYDQSTASNSLGYALVTRLTGKWLGSEGAEKQREVLWLKFSQNYDLDSDVRAFTDLRSQLILRPTTLSALTLDIYYDMDLKSISDSSVTGSLSDSDGNGFAATYRKRPVESGLAEISNLNFSIDVALLKPVYLHYEQRYDILESNSLEQIVALDIRQQCWGLKTTFSEREDERSVLFILTLSGIGELGQWGKSFDRN